MKGGKVSDHVFRVPAPFDHVEVRFGPLMADLSALTNVDSHWFSDDISVYRGPGFTVAVHGVDLVEVDIDPGVQPLLVQAALYGRVMRFLYLHSGVFALHASLLGFGAGPTSQSVAVAGHSGAGKSTTVSHTAGKHGAVLLVDDVLPVTVAAGVATAYPFDRPVHLLPDAAARLGLEGGDEIHTGLAGGQKYVTALASGGDPLPLVHLVSLQLGEPDAPEPLVVRSITGAQRFRHIVRNSNVTGLSSFGARADSYFRWATELAACVDMTEIIRRPGDDTLDEVAGLIAGIVSSPV